MHSCTDLCVAIMFEATRHAELLIKRMLISRLLVAFWNSSSKPPYAAINQFYGVESIRGE